MKFSVSVLFRGLHICTWSGTRLQRSQEGEEGRDGGGVDGCRLFCFVTVDTTQVLS